MDRISFLSGSARRDSHPPRVIFRYSLFYVAYLQVALHFSTSLDNAIVSPSWYPPYGSYLLYPCFFTLLVVMFAVESARRFGQIVFVSVLTNGLLIGMALVEQRTQLFDLPESATSKTAIMNNLGGTFVLLFTLKIAMLALPRLFRASWPLAISMMLAIGPALALDALLFAAILSLESPEPIQPFLRLSMTITCCNLLVSGLVLVLMHRFLESHRAAIISAHQIMPELDRADHRWRAAITLGRELPNLLQSHPGQWVLVQDEMYDVFESYAEARETMWTRIQRAKNAGLHEQDFLIQQLIVSTPTSRSFA
ncbi:MAG: hypothetical protein ACRCZF_27430 [Gemmataceae bacterium]